MAGQEPMGFCLRTKLNMLLVDRIRRKTARCSLTTWLLSLLCLLAPGNFAKGASSPEEALRARVAQCYTALEQGDWKKAEKYLTKESRPSFRNQTKKPLAAYQIESIKLDPDGRTASVVIQLPIISVATPRPILISKPTVWRLVNHTWYMDLPRVDPGTQSEMNLGLTPDLAKPPVPPASVNFSADLKFESTWSGLGQVHAGEVKTARYAFTNVSKQVVTLSEFQLGCDCLRLKTQQMQYKPGESGALEFEFDASKLRLNRTQSFQQDIVFKTEPDGAYVKLSVAAVMLAPGSTTPAKQ